MSAISTFLLLDFFTILAEKKSLSRTNSLTANNNITSATLDRELEDRRNVLEKNWQCIFRKIALKSLLQKAPNDLEKLHHGF